MAFALTGDFNRDGRPDLAETAVGQLASGERVTVLLITTPGRAERPTVFTQPGNGFSVVYLESGDIAWSPCMECGQVSSIHWSSKQHKYVELEPEDFGAEPSNNSFKPKPLRGSA
ncbi:hypothetical protein GCM10027430_28990 [Lysobacter tyrosinilyticus]